MKRKFMQLVSAAMTISLAVGSLGGNAYAAGMAEEPPAAETSIEARAAEANVSYPGYVNLAYHKSVRAEGTITMGGSGENPTYVPAKAVDGDMSTRWATGDTDVNTSYTINFGEETTFNRVTIRQAYPERIRQYVLYSRTGDEWSEIKRGTAGSGAADEPITAFNTIYLDGECTTSELKIAFERTAGAPGGVTIWEIGVYHVPEDRNVTIDYNKSLPDYKEFQKLIQSDEPMNWAFLGDSLTHGCQYTENFRRYADLFEANLKTDGIKTETGIKVRPKDKIETTAVAGAAISEFISHRHDFMDLTQADVAFVCYGMNDVGWVSAVDYKNQISQCIDIIRSTGAIPVLQTSNTMNRSKQPDPSLSANRLLNLALFMEIMKEVAQEKQVMLVDNYDFWEMSRAAGEPVREEWFPVDNTIHESPWGQLMWGQTLLNALDMMNPDSAMATVTKDAYTAKYEGAYIDPGKMYLSSQDTEAPKEGTVVSYDINKIFDGNSAIDKSEDSKQLQSVTSGTIVSKFKINPLSDGSRNIIFSASGSGGEGLQTGLSADGKIYFSLGETEVISRGNRYDDGKWHVLAVSVTGSSAVLYADGAQVGSGSVPEDFLHGISELNRVFAGGNRKSGSGDAYFDGFIDYIAVYDTAKTAAEIGNFTYENNLKKVKEQITPYAGVGPNQWLFIGGATTEGINGRFGVRKNFVQSFEEILRWEISIAGPGNQRRYKLVLNHSRDGLRVSEMDEQFDELIKAYEPEVTLIMPEVVNKDGGLLENNLESFKLSLSSLVDKAKAISSVVLQTPAVICAEAAPYMEAVKETAAQKGVILIDAYGDVNSAVQQNPSMRSEWFYENGMASDEAQNYMAKKLCTEVLTDFPAKSRLRTLTYADQSVPEREYLDIAPGCEVDVNCVDLDLTEILDKSHYTFSSLDLYSVGEGGVLTAQASVQKGEKSFSLLHVPNGSHVYQLVGTVSNHQGTQLKTVSFDQVSVDINQTDKNALQKAYDIYSAYRSEDYASGGWTEFSEAVQQAETMLKQESGDFAGVRDTLAQAAGKLVNIVSLKNRIEEAKNYLKDELLYTAASWSPFKTSLTEAEAVLLKPDTTDQEVQNAENDLLNRMDALKKAAFAFNFALKSNGALLETNADKIHGIFAPENAIDGNAEDDTRWYASKSDSADNDALTAELTFACTAEISRVVLSGTKTMLSNGGAFTIELKQSDGTYVEAASGLELTGDGIDQKITPVEAVGMRVSVNQKTNAGINFREISAYGQIADVKGENAALASNGAAAASADTLTGNSYTPDKAIDGNSNALSGGSCWASIAARDVTLEITLPKAVYISSAVITEYTQWGQRLTGYDIEVADSDSSDNYTLIGRNITGSSDMKVAISALKPAKKVRFTFHGNDRAAAPEGGINIAEIALYSNGKATVPQVPFNVALNKEASSSDHIVNSGVHYLAEYAVDGIFNTAGKWFCTKEQGDQWLQIDFGRPADISKVIMYQKTFTVPVGGFAHLKIETSLDNTTFKTVYDQANTSHGDLDAATNDWKNTYTFAETSARYIRFTFRVNDANGIHIDEMQVYGISEVHSANVSKLTKVLEVAEQRITSESKYTEESYARFKETYDQASAIMENVSATQQEVDDQVRALTDDIYALKKTQSDRYRVKVACVGDSITYGAGAVESNYPKQLQSKFGVNYEVRNFGVSGRTMVSKGDYPYMSEKAYANSLDFQPDVVFIMLGTNDTKPKYQPYLSGFEKDATELIDSYKLLESQPIIYLNTSPTIFGNGMGSGNDAITEKVMVDTILPMQKEIIKQSGVKSIDVHELTKDKSSIFPDHVHGNAQGYAYLAEITANEMKSNQEIVRAGLNSFIDGKTGMAQGNYTKQTWDKFTLALSGAKETLAKTNASITDMNAAEKSLEAAFSGLEYNNIPDFAKKTTKVACVGDSITYGGFANELQKKLGSAYNVGNFGHNGRTVNNTIDRNGQPESYLTCEEYQQSKDFQPDVVIIMLGTNDGKHMYWQKTVENTFAQNFKNNLKNLVSIYESLPSKPVVFLASSPYARQNSDTSPGAIQNPATWIHADYVNLDIVPLQRQTAKETGVKFLDVNEYTRVNVPDSSVPDGIHGGYPQIAAYVSDQLSKDAGMKKIEFGRLIAACSELKEDDYEAAAWEEFQTALSEAKTDLRKPMSFAQADEATERLRTARARLTVIIGPDVNMAAAENGGKITAVTSELNNNYLAKYVIDGNENTSSGNLFWGTDAKAAAAAGRKAESIEITLDRPIRLNKAVIMEYYGSTWITPAQYRVASFTIEAASETDGTYKKVYEGTAIGNRLEVKIPESNIQAAKKVRLTFTPNAKGREEGMNLAEIKLFGLPLEPEKPTEQEITGITNPSALTVEFGTAFHNLDLPQTVKVILTDKTEKDVKTVWEQGSYDGEKAGDYKITGTLLPEEGITNPQKLAAEITVRVKEKPEPEQPEPEQPVNRKELQELYNSCLNLKEQEYTKESWSVYKKAFDSAASLLADETVSDAQKIQKAIEELKAAVNALKKPVQPPAAIRVASISLKAASTKMAAGKKASIQAKVYPSAAADKTLIWKSSNTRYATVNAKGVVSFKKAGAGKNVTITAVAKDGSGVKKSLEFKIYKNPVKKIILKASAKTIKAGKTLKVQVTVLPKKQVNKTLQWNSSNTKYATVNKNGHITARKAGKGKTVKITARAMDGSKSQKTIRLRIK